MVLKVQALRLPHKQYQRIKGHKPKNWIGRLWQWDKSHRHKNMLVFFKHVLKYAQQSNEPQAKKVAKSAYDLLKKHQHTMKGSTKLRLLKLESKYHKHNQTPVTNTIAEKLICPITLDEIKHPVITPCNHIFERAALHEWLLDHWECPMDRKPLFSYQVKAL